MATVRKYTWADFGPELGTWLKANFERVDLMRSCLTCHNFHEASETCVKFRAKPPARVIANGCDGYNDSHDVPF